MNRGEKLKIKKKRKTQEEHDEHIQSEQEQF